MQITFTVAPLQYICLQYACLIVGSASFSLCSKASLSLIINLLVCVFKNYNYYLLCNYFVSYT